MLRWKGRNIISNTSTTSTRPSFCFTKRLSRGSRDEAVTSVSRTQEPAGIIGSVSLCHVRCDISRIRLIEGDRSRKGSVDTAIVDLIEEMNRHPLMYTTSSCSGRVSLFEEDLMGCVGRKGGEWIYVSHQEPEWNELYDAMQRWREGDGTKREGKDKRWNFRFEPFIVACECGTLETARMLVQIGREAGFRESGIVLGKDRIQATVRSAARTEIPVCEHGIMLMAESSWDVLLRIVREKFRKNGEKIDAFRHLFHTTFASQTGPSLEATPDDRRPAYEDGSLRWQTMAPRHASVCPFTRSAEMHDGLFRRDWSDGDTAFARRRVRCSSLEDMVGREAISDSTICFSTIQPPTLSRSRQSPVIFLLQEWVMHLSPWVRRAHVLGNR